MGDDLPIAARHQLAQMITKDAERRDPISPWLVAADQLVTDEAEQAAETYARIGSLPDEATARLHAGPRRIEQGCRSEGEVQLQKA